MQKVRKGKELRQIPFIFYAATYTGQKDEDFAMSIGEDGFIHKPCDLDEFLDAMNQITAAAVKRDAASSFNHTSSLTRLVMDGHGWSCASLSGGCHLLSW